MNEAQRSTIHLEEYITFIYNTMPLKISEKSDTREPPFEAIQK